MINTLTFSCTCLVTRKTVKSTTIMIKTYFCQHEKITSSAMACVDKLQTPNIPLKGI